MKDSLFDYTDYKKYLADWIETRSGGARGSRSRLAEALRCHLAYVSRVLSGGAHFSLEQAHVINTFVGHTSEEADFFLLLVSYGRAGTADLQTYYLGKMKAEANNRTILKNRLQFKKALSEVDQTTYFSAWYYSAIHLLLGIPQLQTKESLARYLKLPTSKVGQVLQFLVSSGLATEKKGRYARGTSSIHLGNDSPMISKHHTNWRIQAIQSLELERPDELHYSSVITLSRTHVAEIRKIMVSAIEQIRGKVKDSADECSFCYSMDLFEVGGTLRE